MSEEAEGLRIGRRITWKGIEFSCAGSHEALLLIGYLREDHEQSRLVARYAEALDAIKWLRFPKQTGQHFERSTSTQLRLVRDIAREALNPPAEEATPAKDAEALSQAANSEVAKGKPVMVRINGSRFACEECQVTVFTKVGSIYRCNGCQTEYEGEMLLSEAANPEVK